MLWSINWTSVFANLLSCTILVLVTSICCTIKALSSRDPFKSNFFPPSRLWSAVLEEELVERPPDAGAEGAAVQVRSAKLLGSFLHKVQAEETPGQCSRPGKCCAHPLVFFCSSPIWGSYWSRLTKSIQITSLWRYWTKLSQSDLSFIICDLKDEFLNEIKIDNIGSPRRGRLF